ncbi:hypothetical protein AKJ37_07070, partial [candidate division MSBL1 archaeon SCGC-AAA259I09]
TSSSIERVRSCLCPELKTSLKDVLDSSKFFTGTIKRLFELIFNVFLNYFLLTCFGYLKLSSKDGKVERESFLFRNFSKYL